MCDGAGKAPNAIRHLSFFGCYFQHVSARFSPSQVPFFVFLFFSWPLDQTMASLEALNANEIGIFGLNGGREQNETRAYVYIAMAKLLSWLTRAPQTEYSTSGIPPPLF